ncbi:hypothetical protein OIU76_022023 [Salix suchowensis]|nr:hypothetical protein OIU76_022023 [Salix suchowensis]
MDKVEKKETSSLPACSSPHHFSLPSMEDEVSIPTMEKTGGKISARIDLYFPSKLSILHLDRSPPRLPFLGLGPPRSPASRPLLVSPSSHEPEAEKSVPGGGIPSLVGVVQPSSVIRALNNNHRKPPSFYSIFSIFNPLLLTYMCNSLLILSANATAFSLLFLTYSLFLENIGFGLRLFLSAAGAVVYSIILAHTIIVCNLALVLSGEERVGGYMAILKACVMIRGRASTALSLTLAANIAMAGVEALFQHRIVRAYRHRGETPGSLLIISEGTLIIYVYSILAVLDTIISCIFFKSCKATCCRIDDQEQGKCAYRINENENGGSNISFKV